MLNNSLHFVAPPVKNFNQNRDFILPAQSNEEDRLKQFDRIESSRNNNNSIINVDNIPQDTTCTTSVSSLMPKLPKVNSIRSEAQFNCTLNLKHIALSLKNTLYPPKSKKFDYVQVIIKNPRATFKVFSSGKIHCLGTKTELDSIRACRILAKQIKSLAIYKVRLSDFKILYVHTTADTRFEISFFMIKNLLKDDSKFRVEDLNSKSTAKKGGKEKQFPGLKVKKKFNPSVTLMLFHSGKINITGVKNQQEAIDTFNEFFPYLQKSKVNK